MKVDTGKLVTVFGGSGFIGRYVVHALARRGHRIRVADRRPDLAVHLLPIGRLGQIHSVQANLRFPWSVHRAVEGSDHVVNLVGILAEAGPQNFDALHHAGARAVAEAALGVGAGLTQMSALGADPESASAYARSKAAGERAVFEVAPAATVIRPSIVFGAEDQFFNRFAEMARFSPVLPLVGGGRTRFQPIFVGDVAEAIADTVEGRVPFGRVYELGGSEVLSFRELMVEMLRVIDRRRPLVSIPFGVARPLAKVLQYLPGKLLTPDQVEQLGRDNVVSAEAVAENRSIAAFNIQPRTLAAVLPTYLVHFRPNGQFTRNGPLSDDTVDEEIA